MKLGHFITANPLDFQAAVETKVENPWADMHFNERAVKLTPSYGLMTFGKSFEIKKKVKSATLRITSLGIFEAVLNGQRVHNGDSYDELTPLWTDYNYRVMEYEYDLVPFLKKGMNRLTTRVSNGWWSGRISFGTYGLKETALCAEIELVYADGETEILPSDTDWDSTFAGPVMRADIWDGEYDDARVADPARFPDTCNWKPALLAADVTTEIVPFKGNYVRVNGVRQPMSAVEWVDVIQDGSEFGRIKPIRSTLGYGNETGKLKAGHHLMLDMGQNMVGRPVLTIKANKGVTIECLFAEMLNDAGESSRGNDGPKGSIYIKNYRSAMARYTCVADSANSRKAQNEFKPLHTFFGFRYLEITADQDIEIEQVKAEVIGSSLHEYGDFSCSNAEVNQLFSNIRWGMRGNYLSVPTDCPQRDERLGWTGDTQIFSGAASYLADIKAFMEKWLIYDAQDSQRGYDGAYSDVIPRLKIVGDGAAAWGDAGIIVPYKMYQMYNDLDLIRNHFDSMEYYMHYLEQFGLEGPKTSYGDWLNYDITDKRYIAVCYYAYDAYLMSIMARAIGLEDKASYYDDLRARIIAHYEENYVKDGEIQIQTQTGYLLPLAFSMIDGELKEKAIAHLSEKIIANNYTLSTGFVGTGILNQTLAVAGLDQLAYSLLFQTNDPSWLYSVRQGATTIWERWNSYTKAKGFGDVGMNSFNHYAYGAVAEWMFAYVLGIRPDPKAPGFEKSAIMGIRPDFRKAKEIPAGQTRMTHAEGTFRGFTSAWEYKNQQLCWTLTVPTEQAVIQYPIFKKVTSLVINGVEMTLAQLKVRKGNGYVEFVLPAGHYVIEGEVCKF